jgi:endonuclease III
LGPLFEELKSQCPDWADVLKLGKTRFRKLIRPLGLANIRTTQIFGILRKVQRDRGEVSLQFLDVMADSDVETYLTSLPGVGLKTARCVMLYSLGRQSFPVDTHTLRLFHYLGITSKRLRHDTAQDVLQALVPGRYRFKLHVNIVAHGQQTCLPRQPKCDECVVRSICHHRTEKEPTKSL